MPPHLGEHYTVTGRYHGPYGEGFHHAVGFKRGFFFDGLNSENLFVFDRSYQRFLFLGEGNRFLAAPTSSCRRIFIGNVEIKLQGAQVLFRA